MEHAATLDVESDATLTRHAEQLYEVLSDLMRVYQFRDRDRICCHDLSVSQCYALDALVRRGPISLNELAAHLYLDKSTVSRIVAALERKKLAARASHPGDARALQLAATGDGRRLYRTILREITEREKKLLAQFTPEVRQAMISLVGELAAAAAARVSTGGGACWCLD